MYAAAGGASLASRQARQRQRQQNKTKQLQAKLHPASKALAIEAAAGTPTRSQQPSRQFHQLPSTYLRTPQAQARKLSASYTAQSKLLLPIDEGDGQSVHMHHAHHHHDFHGRTSTPKLVHRHSGSGGVTFHHSHLTKSATATLPLVSQMDATPPTTPLIAVSSTKPSESDATPVAGQIQIQVPQDSIIVTPATPIASPGHIPREPTTSVDDDNIAPPVGQLERKCSVYRMRRSDAFEQENADNANVAHQFEPCTDETSLIFKGLPNGGSGGHKWQPCAYCEEGICFCEHIECAQGRAAWLERGRRCSVQDNNPTACHRRWVKRNRIQDASLGGSSDDEDFLGVLRGPSTFANAFLYVGLGTIALGLVIAFVGTGEKGFKTVELRLIGPSLIGIGLICCILRILFCICPSHCISSSKKARKKQGNKVDADHTTSLLRGETKRVSIARGPHTQKYPITHKKSNSKMLNEGMEALRQIATTSLFLQNEQKPSMNRVVPIIKEPEKNIDAPLEMKKFETTQNVSEVSDDEEFDEEKESMCVIVPTTSSSRVNEKPPLERSASKLSRQRMSLNQQHQLQQQQHLTTQTSSESGDLLMETSLMVIKPTVSTNKETVTIPPPPSQSTTSPTKAASPSLPSSSSNFLSPAVQSMSLHVQPQPTVNSNFDLPPSTPHKPTRTVGFNNHNTVSTVPSTTTAATPTIGAQYQLQQQQNNLPGQIMEIGNPLQSASKTVTTSLPGSGSIETSSRLTTSLTTATTASSSNSNSFSLGNTLVPPSTMALPSAAALKFEPELLLSPAKLGQ